MAISITEKLCYFALALGCGAQFFPCAYRIAITDKDGYAIWMPV